MRPDKELLALVRSVAASINDTARVAVADWLDEHPDYQRTPVEHCRPPKGFLPWFQRTVLPLNRDECNHGRRRKGRWYFEAIVNLFNNMQLPTIPNEMRHQNWFDHGGFSKIAGNPVIVGEPYGTERESQVTAAILQNWFSCPVTYDRKARHNREALRLVVWFSQAVRLG